jgi:hypothetical protein
MPFVPNCLCWDANVLERGCASLLGRNADSVSVDRFGGGWRNGLRIIGFAAARAKRRMLDTELWISKGDEGIDVDDKDCTEGVRLAPRRNSGRSIRFLWMT